MDMSKLAGSQSLSRGTWRSLEPKAKATTAEITLPSNGSISVEDQNWLMQTMKSTMSMLLAEQEVRLLKSLKAMLKVRKTTISHPNTSDNIDTLGESLASLPPLDKSKLPDRAKTDFLRAISPKPHRKPLEKLEKLEKLPSLEKPHGVKSLEAARARQLLSVIDNERDGDAPEPSKQDDASSEENISSGSSELTFNGVAGQRCISEPIPGRPGRTTSEPAVLTDSLAKLLLPSVGGKWKDSEKKQQSKGTDFSDIMSSKVAQEVDKGSSSRTAEVPKRFMTMPWPARKREKVKPLAEIQRASEQEALRQNQRSLESVGQEAVATPSGYLNFTTMGEADLSHRVHVRIDSEQVAATPELGAETEEHADTGLLITSIRSDGLLPQWNNKQQHGTCQVCVGDWVVEVNGQSSNLAGVLAQRIEQHLALDVHVVHEGASMLYMSQESGRMSRMMLGEQQDEYELPCDDEADEEEPGGEGGDQNSVSATSRSIESKRAVNDQCSGNTARFNLVPPSEEQHASYSSLSSSSSSIGGRPMKGAASMPAMRNHDRTWSSPIGQLKRLVLKSENGVSGPKASVVGKVRSAGSSNSGESNRRCNSSEETAIARKPSHWLSSLGATSAAVSVQLARQRREDGLVEAMEQTQPFNLTLGSLGLTLEASVCAPLWLCVCSVVRWQCGGRPSAFTVAYQFLVIAVMLSIIGFFVFSVVYVQVTPCDQAQEVCLGYSHMSDLTLAIGSLLGLLALRTLSSSGVLGSSEAWLVAYARRQEITKDWSVAMKSNNLRLGLLWVSSLTLRGVNLLQRKRVQGWWSPMELASVASFLVISLVFLSTIYGILHVCSCLGMLIDSYVSHFDQEDFRLETSVYEWNLLQAVLRKVSNSVEKSFLVVQTTSLALVLLAASQLYRGEAGSLTTLGIASTSLLVFGVMVVFFKASEVSERCMRMPALINSLHFGKHVDTKRHYLVEFVTYSHAGFYVGEVRLTTAIALKLTYFAGAIAFAGLSQLYYTNDSS